jgi:hypothetical protein
MEGKKMSENTARVLPFDAPAKKPGFGDLLGKMAPKTETAKKKSTVPTIGNAPPEVREALDEYLEADTQEKKAKGVKEVCGPIVHDFFRGVQDADGYAGKFHTTYAIVGNQATGKVGNKNAFSISPEDAGTLQEILGDSYGDLIVQKPSLTVKAEVFTDTEMQDRLAELLGDEFLKFFDLKISLGTCEEFTRRIYQVVPPEKLEVLRTYAKQYKPTIR